MAGLSLLPVLVALKDSRHPYQFSKLLLTVGPLLALGLALWRHRQVANLPPRTALTALPLGLALLAAGVGTGRMVLRTADDEPAPRSFAHIMHSDTLVYLQDTLRAVPASDLVLAQHHPFLDSWMAYLGAEHRLWLFEPDFLHPWAIPHAQRQGVLDVADLPASVMVLTANPHAPGRCLSG